MEKVDDSQYVSSLKDWQSGLDPDMRGAGSSTVSRDISLLDFDSDTNRRIPSPEAIQANSDKGNKQSNACHMERQGYV